MKELRVKAENISKSFTADIRRQESTLAAFLGFFQKKEKKQIIALRDISFEVKAGECLAIIGRNGSGKTTLLRTIAGIYSPDKGQIFTQGKMVFLAGFKQGLAPRLTMRENIFLAGSLMGMERKSIKEKFDEIVNFSELADFLDMKVYQFSTGMVSRLNFSVAIHSLNHQNPDILLLDEVFNSGGDMEFQEKSLKKTEELIAQGSAVIMATHSMGIAKKYCGKAILLENGEAAALGSSEDVAQKYMDKRQKNSIQEIQKR